MKNLASLLLGALVLLAPTLAPPAQAQDVKVEYGVSEDDDVTSEKDVANAKRKVSNKRVDPKAMQCVQKCQEPSVKCMTSCGTKDPSCVERCAAKMDKCQSKCDTKSFPKPEEFDN